MSKLFITCHFIIFFQTLSFGQHLRFDDVPLDKVFSNIESNSSYRFNFDVLAVNQFHFSGEVSLDDMDTSVRRLLYATPFDFEKNKQIYLIKATPAAIHSICGYLKDSSLGIPLEYGHVYLSNGDQGIFSDSEGYFNLKVSAQKHDTMIISYLGYKKQFVLVEDLNTSRCPTVNLEVNDNILGKEIVITDYIVQGITEGKNYGGYEIIPSQAKRQLTTQTEDPLQMVEILPGISSYNESTTNLSIRGNSPDQNLVVWEGVNLYSSGHFFGMTSAVNPFSIRKISVYKDVFDPQFDHRIGGVIDLSMGDHIPLQGSGSVGLSLTEAHFNYQFPLISEKIGLDLSFRRSLTDFFESPTLQSYRDKTFQGVNIEDEQVQEGSIEDSPLGPVFYDLSSKLLWNHSKKWTSSIAFLKVNDEAENLLSFDEGDLGVVQNFLESTNALSLRSKYGFKGSSEIELFYHRSQYHSDGGGLLFELAENLEFYETLFSNDLLDVQSGVKGSLGLSSKASLDVGYSFEHKKVRYEVSEASSFNDGFMYSVEGKDDFHNLFSAFNWSSERFSMDAGFRATHRVSNNQFYWSPRFNIRYSLNDNITFKSSVGRFHQFVSKLFDFSEASFESSYVWTLSDAAQDVPMLSNKFSAGWIYSKNDWLLDLGGYWTQTDGLSSFNTRLVQDINLENELSSRIAGVELLVKKSWKRYILWINYDYSKSRFYGYDKKNSFPGSLDQPHKLSVVNSLIWDKLRLSLMFQYKSPLPYSIPSVVSDFDGEDLDYYLSYGKINEGRLDPYRRLDISGTYTFSLKGRLRGEIGLSILNLLNQSNSYARDFYLRDVNEDDGGGVIPEIYTLDRQLLGWTPRVSLRFFW